MLIFTVLDVSHTLLLNFILSYETPPLHFLDKEKAVQKMICWSSQVEREWGITWHSFLWKPVTFLWHQSASLWPLREITGKVSLGNPFLHWGHFSCAVGPTLERRRWSWMIRFYNLVVSSKVQITDLENWLYKLPLAWKRLFRSQLAVQSPTCSMMDLMVDFPLSCYYLA